ncbi:MAG: lamin tail domain-containing protein [Candidatus Paceibacterota bacterium]
MFRYIFLFSIFFLPAITHANVIFSEIAWMGTTDSQFEEWIELRNTGSESVSLSGWKIYKAGGATVLFSLSGSIDSGEYLVVCRITASVTNPLSGGCDLSGSFGGSGLNNTSEHIILKDSSGGEVDEINASGGWLAGSSSTKETMQKSGSGWVTGEPTPGSANVSGGSDPVDNEDENEEEEEEDMSSSSSSSSTLPSTKKYSKEVVDIKVVDSSVPVGTPVKFSLDTRDLNGANILRGEFFWNMGDGTERYYRRNEKFEHTYDHEGTYIVYLKYYSTYFEGMEPEVVDKITITVGNPSIIISKIHGDGSVEIKNTSSQEIDLSSWVIKDVFGRKFLIPDGTYIAGSKTLTFNSKRTKIAGMPISIFSPNGSLVSSFSNISTSSTTSSVAKSSSSASSSSSSKVSSENLEKESDEVINLNERLTANASSSKQKQPSLWMIVFVALLFIVSAFVFFLYRKEGTEPKEEDDFELIE